MFRKNAQGTALARRSDAGLSPWSPWQAMTDMQRQMDEMFARSFGYTPLSRMIPETRDYEPGVDIYETDDRVVVLASLPGFEPDAVQVEATEDTLLIQGERKPLFENEKAVAHRQSWQSGSTRFSASYSLPSEINPNDVKATFRHGILRVELPKAEHARPKSVKVDVSAGA